MDMPLILGCDLKVSVLRVKRFLDFLQIDGAKRLDEAPREPDSRAHRYP